MSNTKVAANDKSAGELMREAVAANKPGSIWDNMVALAFNVEIIHETDTDDVTPFLDMISIPFSGLNESAEYGGIEITRNAGEPDWNIHLTQGFDGYSPAETRSLIQDLQKATDIATMLNLGHAA